MTTVADLFSWAVRSDVGRVREINQDTAHAAPPLFVVADGMGGHRGGEVASEVAVEVLADAVPESFTIEDLIERVQTANSAIIARAEADMDLAGMGTTLCAVGLLEGDWTGAVRLGFVNVGDSRIYRFADDELRQLSDDHSLVGTMLRAGQLTADEAASHPQRNIVTRALGISDQVEVDYWELPARLGEKYLLCSDGLVDEVTDAQIAATFRRLEDPEQVADELIRLANESGARDNVTVVIVRVDGGEAGPADALPQTPLVAPTEVGAASGDAADLGEPVADPGDVDSSRPRARRSIQKRTIALVVAVVAVLVLAIVLVGVYARDNYYVDFDNDQVVIYQGRPGGVLWFDPTVEEPTPLLRGDLTPALELEIQANPEFGSIDEANGYVDGLGARADAGQAQD